MMLWFYIAGAIGLGWLVLMGIEAAFRNESPDAEKPRCKCCWCEEERRGER